MHGDIVPIARVLEIVREANWCRLETPADDFTVHVGYDYYLYIASTKDCVNAATQVNAGKLFAERFDQEGSPYTPNDG